MTSPTSSTAASPTVLTANAVVNSLLDGWHWSSSAISYSFIAPYVSYFANNYPDNTFWSQISALSAIQQGATQRALTQWSDVANIQFTQTVDNASAAGTLRLGFSYSHSWGDFVGWTYLPYNSPSAGDVWRFRQ